MRRKYWTIKFAGIRKVLFIASHRKDRAPNQRFRFEQYFGWLEQHGYRCELSFLLSAEDDKLLYSAGNYWKKGLLLLRNYRQRQQDLKKAGEYDIIFIAREAMMLSSTSFERAFAQSGAKVIYDFDDAIWLNDTSHANRFFAWMKKPEKIEKSIAYAHLVFAGNGYLAEYARKFNGNVMVVPTTIDTDEYARIPIQR